LPIAIIIIEKEIKNVPRQITWVCVYIPREKKKVGLYIKSINDIGMNYETKMSQQNEIIAYT
jgi:hypothetical protein